MRLDLSGPRQRHDWAQHHFTEMYALVTSTLKAYNDAGGFTFDQRFDADTSCYVFTLRRTFRLPDDVGLRIGDVLHSLRSTLDHLAWALVKAGHDSSPARPEQVAFPICDTSRDFKGKRRSSLPGVRGDQRQLVRLTQPYQQTVLGDVLTFVRDYNNRDKHRVTHAHFLRPRVGNFEYKARNCEPGEPIPDLGGIPPRLDAGNDLLWIPVRVLRPDHSLEAQGDLTPYVGFDGGENALELLAGAYTHVGALIDSFDHDWP